MAMVEKQLGGAVLGDLPQGGWQKVFFKAPLLAWRTGMRRLLPPMFACITTKGRKSGLPRHTMLEHYQFGGKYYITSGWQDKAQWVKNLLTDPAVTIQPVWGKPVYGTAQRVQRDEDMRRAFEGMQASPMWEPWLQAQGIAPNVDDFVANKEQVYIFQITPSGDTHLPPLEEDLRWLTWAVFGSVALFLLIRQLSRN